MSVDWNDAASRAAFIERVGREAYLEAFEAHLAASVVETVNGYPIRPVGSRFGRLFMVGGAEIAFSTLDQARSHAMGLPPREPAVGDRPVPAGESA